MNKKELKARCTELGLDTEALDKASASQGKIATNKELKKAIADAEALIHTANLKKEAEGLGIDVSELDTDAKLDAAILAKKPPENSSTSTLTKTSVKNEAPVYEDSRGLKWQFKQTAPKTINIDGRSMTQEEIIEDEAIISELVFGNSSFLTQKH